MTSHVLHMTETTNVPVHATRSCRGTRGVAPLVFNLCVEVSGQHRLRQLYSRERTWHPFNMRLGGPQSRSGRFGEEKKSCLRRNSNPESSSP